MMTLEQINQSLRGAVLIRLEQQEDGHSTTSLIRFREATPDACNKRWCTVKTEDGQRSWFLRKDLLEELVREGLAVFHRSNLYEIEARREAGLFPLPQYRTFDVTYVVSNTKEQGDGADLIKQ